MSTWTPRDGVMEYSEIRIREVNEGKVDMQRYMGFLFSEKIDGWHVVWDGCGKLWTKSGNVSLPAPAWFTQLFPTGVAISGELVLKNQHATDVSKLRRPDGPWENARFYAFDLPGDRQSTFASRTKRLRGIVFAQCLLRGENKCRIRYVRQTPVTDTEEFLETFHAITQCTGEFARDECFGEGVVLTDPGSLYVSGRAGKHTRVKLKVRRDAEAEVVGHLPASIRVRLPTGVEFTLGIGFTNQQRQNLQRDFPVGTWVKFSYRAFSAGGVPKEARYIGTRDIADMPARPSLPDKLSQTPLLTSKQLTLLPLEDAILLVKEVMKAAHVNGDKEGYAKVVDVPDDAVLQMQDLQQVRDGGTVLVVPPQSFDTVQILGVSELEYFYANDGDAVTGTGADPWWVLNDALVTHLLKYR